MRVVTVVSAIVFAIVALAHLLRAFWGVEVIAGGRIVPVWMSVAAFIGAGALAVANLIAALRMGR